MINIIPSLMRNLSHSTQKEIYECRGIIRGRVDWNLTFKERYGRGYNDPSLFLCKPASKMYDLPENQLLKFLLWKIRKLSENIGILTDIPDEVLEEEQIKNWSKLIAKRYLKAKKALKSIYFQDIYIPRIIKPKHVQKTKNNRNKLYRSVANCYDLYKRLFIDKEKDSLKQLIEKQILEPLDNDKLFEIFILFKILEEFENKDGNLEFGLLKSKKGQIAQYIDEKKIINIFYQQTPPIFYYNSEYKEILECYDLKTSLRRPDIVLEIESEDSRFLIIEIKRTENKKYILESVYKVLGYISDFKIQNQGNPNAILVVWDKISILKQEALEKSVLIVPHYLMNNKLNELDIF